MSGVNKKNEVGEVNMHLRKYSSVKIFSASLLFCAGLAGCSGGADTEVLPVQPTLTQDDVTMISAAELVAQPAPSIYMSALGSEHGPAIRGGEVEVFVRLSEPSVAEFCANEVLAGRPEPDATSQKMYSSTIDAAQSLVGSQLAALGARELSRLRAGDNGIRIQVDASNIEGIRSIAGVTAVVPVTRHTPNLERSVPWIGAAAVQAGGVDGTGITIAIIDTGIDYNHASLGGSGDPADYAANDPNIIEPGSFPTMKVIGGYDFAGALYDAGDPAISTPTPDPDPLDGVGHGSHVGGIASGMGVPGELGVGVAPGAKLMALKVFGDTGGSTSLTSDAIEFALDPNGDGDTSDHVDVINMSLGSTFGDPADPSAVSADNAAHLGIAVVTSAGNAGPVPYVTGSPGVGGGAISVASSLSGGDTLGFSVSGGVNDTFEVVEGTGAVRLSDGIVVGDLMQPADAANLFGCNPIADDMNGAIALISRGECDFDTKYINAQDAGAVAIVVRNDGTDPARVAPIIMGGIGDLGVPITIPGVMTTSDAGFLLADTLSGGTGISATLDESIMVPTLFGDTMSDFSSSGPGHGGSTFKPDVTAPGDAISSTYVGTGTEGVIFGGTSMAAPHVAGLAALLRQARPGLDPAGIKAVIQNSTSTAVGDGTIGPTPALSRQGTGVVNAVNALALTSMAQPGGVSFGRINPDEFTRASKPFRVVTMSNHNRQYSVTHVPNQTFPGVKVSCPSNAAVYAGADNRFNIVLTMDPAVGPYDNAFHSQTEVDGWCVLHDGYEELRIGYLAVIDPASVMRAKGNGNTVEIRNKGGNVGWAEGFTLATRSTRPGGAPYSINAVGVRTNSFAAAGDLVEFGISTDRAWESLAPYEIDIFIDIDADGIEDYVLVAADFFGDGVPVTAIFPQGSTLFTTGADLNDASAVLTFIGPTDSPFGSLGFLPPGVTYFDFAAVVVDLRSGAFDVQFGSVDLAREIVPESNSFGLFPRTGTRVPVSGAPGEMLWLFQNNEPENGNGGNQTNIVSVSPR